MNIETLKLLLTNPTVPVLPTDKPRQAVSAYNAASLTFTVSADLIMALNALSREYQASLASVLLTTYQILLYRYTGTEDQLLGIVRPGQTSLSLPVLSDVLDKVLPLRTELTDQTSFAELLAQVEHGMSFWAEQSLADSAENDQLKLAANDLAGLLKLLFSFNTPLSVAAEAGGFTYDLVLQFNESADGLNGVAIYADELFAAATIHRLIDHLLNLLTGVCAAPTAPLYQLPLLTAPERSQILDDWNNTVTPYPQQSYVHTLFEEQAARTPDAIAVSHHGQHISYAELNDRANRLARRLIDCGVKPDALVGICVDRSPDMLAGLLAILKAGGAYLPIDPHNPKDRLAFIVADSALAALLIQSHLADLFDTSDSNLTVLDIADAGLPAAGNPNPVELGLRPENLAYAIYTSGSTGKPKKAGVMHRGLQNQLPWYIRHTGLRGGDAMLLVTSFAFDLSQRVIFGPLLAGARLVLADEPFDPQAIVKLAAREQVTITNLTPSGFHAMIDAAKHGELSSLQRVYLGGEPMQAAKLLEMPEPRPAFVNCYGPTETTATATVFPVLANLEQFRNSPIPIGKPIANARIYILDKHLQLLPIGVSGEIYIGGVPVGRGYLQQDELTAERFLADAFSSESDAKMYKTGDLGRWLADGNIEFLGRNDFQIKLRGFRIEQGEIEAALRQHPQVREVVIDVYEPLPGDKRLAAYCIAETGQRPSIAELHNFLKPLLPAYMLPACYVFIDSLPLNRNGKLDRKALPPPTADSDPRDYATPRNEVESRLIDIWKQVLGVSQIGIHDNFFDMGGYSLLAVTLLQQIKQDFDLELELGRIYHAPTIAELAVEMFSDRQIPWYSLAPIQTQGSRPPLFSIHTISMLDLPQRLGKDQPLYFLRYGMAAKVGAEKIHLPAVPDLAAHYVAEMRQVQPQGPYYLMGFSFGGLVAYEMACQLVADGQQVALLCLLDTYLSSQKTRLPWRQIIRNISKLSFKEFYFKVKKTLRPKSHAAQTEIPEFDPHFYEPEPDRHASRNFEPNVYQGRVTLIQATENKRSLLYHYAAPEIAWREMLGEHLEVLSMPGRHFTIFTEKYIGILADILKSCLDRAIANSR